MVCSEWIKSIEVNLWWIAIAVGRFLRGKIEQLSFSNFAQKLPFH